MNIDIYVAVEGTRQCWSEPKLITKSGLCSIPQPPRARRWQLFVSTNSDDELIAGQPFDVLEAFGKEQYFLLD